MPILSNASPTEKNSPYYLENQKVCEKFEEFILTQRGSVDGKYNATSYFAEAYLRLQSEWKITIKKASYSSGNLLLSSEHQNLHILTTWETHINQNTIPAFRIDRNTASKKLISLLNKKRKSLACNTGYSAFSVDFNHFFYQRVTELLTSSFVDNSLAFVEFRNGRFLVGLSTSEPFLELTYRLDEAVGDKSSL
jgi:hypothetical protein